MPQITLPDHLVAYNLYDLLVLSDPQTPRSVMGLNVQLPDIAANAGAVVEIGRPNSRTAPTSITNTEVQLEAAGAYMFPQPNGNDISLTEKWVNSTIDNTILACSIVQM